VRRYFANPRFASKVGLTVIAAGGLVAGLGNLIRVLQDSGDAQWTFLLDSLGLLIAIVGAALDFRAQLRLEAFDPKGTKRRGAFLLLGGLIGTIGGCWALGWIFTGGTQPVLQFLIAAIMTAGIGALVDGFIHIGWFGSGDYLERRIAQRADEEW
jgi:hypothetical protein